MSRYVVLGVGLLVGLSGCGSGSSAQPDANSAVPSPSRSAGATASAPPTSPSATGSVGPRQYELPAVDWAAYPQGYREQFDAAIDSCDGQATMAAYYWLYGPMGLLDEDGQLNRAAPRDVQDRANELLTDVRLTAYLPTRMWNAGCQGAVEPGTSGGPILVGTDIAAMQSTVLPIVAEAFRRDLDMWCTAMAKSGFADSFVNGTDDAETADPVAPRWLDYATGNLGQDLPTDQAAFVEVSLRTMLADSQTKCPGQADKIKGWTPWAWDDDGKPIQLQGF